jgi:hypothetical protein
LTVDGFVLRIPSTPDLIEGVAGQSTKFVQNAIGFVRRFASHVASQVAMASFVLFFIDPSGKGRLPLWQGGSFARIRLTAKAFYRMARMGPRWLTRVTRHLGSTPLDHLSSELPKRLTEELLHPHSE